MKTVLKSEVSYGEMPNYDSRWPLRLQGWLKSSFWLPDWGPKPNKQNNNTPQTQLQAARLVG